MSNMTRQQVIDFTRTTCLLRARRSALPEQMQEVQQRVRSAMWDGDEQVMDYRAALDSVIRVMFPVTQEVKGDCARCGGTGYIAAFAHIHSGKCVACAGRGA